MPLTSTDNHPRRRRRILPGAILAAATLAVAVIPATASSPARATGSTTPIQHVVVLMQENHTFDSELGGWCAVNPARCPDGGMPSSVTLSDGSVVTPGTTPDLVPPVNHSMQAQIAAVNGGAMNGWQNIPGGGCDAASGYACISSYPASAVPNLASLATTYAVGDRVFTLADSPSWGGHLYEFAGTTDGFSGNNPHPPSSGGAPGWGCDSGDTAQMLPVNGQWVKPQPSCIPDYSLNPAQYPYGGAFAPTVARHVPTILDEMGTAGIPWGIYTAVKPTDPGYNWNACTYFADCLDTAQYSHVAADSQFFTSAAAGTLPAVSFVMPGGPDEKFSQHNMQSNAAGDNWIGKVASAVMASPDWSSTALVITYDDCGCFYDQVPPPLAPDGRQMGPRVPFLVVSPYARPGFTDSTATSSTGSILAFIESTFGLPALGANDAGAYNLAGMFSFTAAPRLAKPALTWRHLPRKDYAQPSAKVLRDDT